MAQQKGRKLNIFSVLSRISTKNTDFFDTLDEVELREFQPFVVMRWLTGTNDARQIYFINELVNPYAFEIRDKRLMFYLMSVATSGQARRYNWIKPASRKGASMSTAIDVIKQFYDYTTKEASEVLSILTNDQIMEHAEDLGLQKEEISKLRKELKTRDGKI